MPEILHNPFGQEHPYEQLPEERTPRQPLAGEPFRIGITTRPPNSVESVTVHLQQDDQPPVQVQAIRNARWRPELEEGVGAEFLERQIKIDQDVWQVQVNAPPVGSTLTYWATSSDGSTTPRFTVSGEAWQPGGVTIHDIDGTLYLKPGDGDTGFPDGSPDPVRIAWLTDGQQARRVRLTFSAQPDEAFFGLGERFNALDQCGQIVDIRVYEQYKNQGKRTYFPIPFLLSSAGYGLFIDSSAWMQFDLCATDSAHWSIEAELAPDESLKLRWFVDSDPVAIIRMFARHTGPVALPPEWAFGLWMSGNEWNSQARVIKEVQASLDLGIQPSVLVIEAWSDETTFYIWNDAEYQPRSGADRFQLGDFTFPESGKWPDPKGMTDWLHAHGIRLLLWQVPVLKMLESDHAQHQADHAHFGEYGLGVHDPDGTLHKVRAFWFRGGYIPDVTNAETLDWWLGKRQYLLDEIGIDGFKTDGGEHMWSTRTRFADGRTGAELWNQFPQLYSEAYYRFANRFREAVTFSRAGYTGSQRSPLHWAGDEHSTWEAFRHSILAGLSAGISGIPFWGWDLGGFSGDIPDAELYLRGAAMAAFCPVMQYHSEFNQHREPSHDRTPWNIQARTGNEQVVPIFRSLLEVRQRLMPYIWREAQHSAATGEPMMRALRLYHSNVSEYHYYFGRDLLVAPVVEPACTVQEVYLPPGTWIDFWSDDEIEGDRIVQAESPLDRIPVFVRAGSSVVDMLR